MSQTTIEHLVFGFFYGVVVLFGFFYNVVVGSMVWLDF